MAEEAIESREEEGANIYKMKEIINL